MSSSSVVSGHHDLSHSRETPLGIQDLGFTQSPERKPTIFPLAKIDLRKRNSRVDRRQNVEVLGVAKDAGQKAISQRQLAHGLSRHKHTANGRLFN
jgi:hypothetical protein